MLFHVTHTHTEATCPYHNDEIRDRSFGQVLPSLTDAGISVVGAWTDPPSHQMFFVLEADSYDALHRGLAPIIDQGTADIRAVTDFGRAVEEVSQRG